MNNNYKSIIINPSHGGIDVGYYDGKNYEKDFSLDVAKSVYNKLNDLGYPVYMTRDSDYAVSIFDRYEYIENVIDESGGDALVFSINVDNNNPNGISIIRSVKSDEETNKELYDQLNNIGEVITKTLPNSDDKDYYYIQRLIPGGSESVVIGYGYDAMKDSPEERKVLGEQIADIIINFFSNVNFNNLGYENYVVQKGDYLYKLAKEFNTTVDNLKKINDLGTDSLNVGQVLKVPKKNGNYYVVQKGDSLYSIAKKFDTTVDKIKDINNLISNKLVVNQRLLIPD